MAINQNSIMQEKKKRAEKESMDKSEQKALEMMENLYYNEEFSELKEKQEIEEKIAKKTGRTGAYVNISGPRPKPNSAPFNFQEYPDLYVDEADCDRNAFTWEGTVENLYTPENKVLTYIGLRITNREGKILAIPQGKIFREHSDILRGVAKGNYVRVWGYMNSQKRTSPDGKTYNDTNYVIYRLKQLRRPGTPSGFSDFTERFGINENKNAQGRDLDRSTLSGVISDIRIIGKHTRKCRFILTSYYRIYTQDSIACIFDMDDNAAARQILKNLRLGSRVYAVGETITARKIMPQGVKDIYTQDFVVNAVYPLKEKVNKNKEDNTDIETSSLQEPIPDMQDAEQEGDTV